MFAYNTSHVSPVARQKRRVSGPKQGRLLNETTDREPPAPLRPPSGVSGRALAATAAGPGLYWAALGAGGAPSVARWRPVAAPLELVAVYIGPNIGRNDWSDRGNDGAAPRPPPPLRSVELLRMTQRPRRQAHLSACNFAPHRQMSLNFGPETSSLFWCK